MWAIQSYVSYTVLCELYSLMWAMQSHVSYAGSYEQYSLIWAIQAHVSDTGSLEQQTQGSNTGFKRYNWNIVESGVKYHNPNPFLLVFLH
jgi:hypothetical protein